MIAVEVEIVVIDAAIVEIEAGSGTAVEIGTEVESDTLGEVTAEGTVEIGTEVEIAIDAGAGMIEAEVGIDTEEGIEENAEGTVGKGTGEAGNLKQ